jgi:hypothetical protein
MLGQVSDTQLAGGTGLCKAGRVKVFSGGQACRSLSALSSRPDGGARILGGCDGPCRRPMPLREVERRLPG